MKINFPGLILALSMTLMSFIAKAQTTSSVFIARDTANRMIQSYLNSIPPGSENDYLRSLVYNADSVRSYLSDPSIKSLKLVLAHTLTYTNGSAGGEPAGTRAGVLTIIIAGVDAQGNYVLRGGNTLLDFATLCPPACFVNGTASADLID